MPGAGVEPPAPPAEAAAALPQRRFRPTRASARRSWPPGCGRFPAPPPAPASVAAVGPGEKGADGGASSALGGRADEAAAPAAILPSVQNGSLHQHQGPDKVEEAVAPATVSPALQNGAPPEQQGLDKVEEVANPAAVSPVAQNSALPHQEQEENKVESLEAILPAACSSALPHALSQLGLERARQDGDRGNNGEARLLGDASEPSSDGQEGNRVMQVVAPMVAVPGSCSDVGASSLQNGDNGDVLLAAKETGCVGSSEVSADGDVTKMGNRTGGGELQRKENGIVGSRTKRWLTSPLNPPPKKRAVSAVRKFPPGCGRTAVTIVSEVVKGSPVPVRTFPPGCGRATVTTINSGVLEVSPISTFAPGCGRSANTNTTGSGSEGLPSEATPVNNVDALVASPVLGEAASPTLEASSKKRERKRMVDEGHGKSHSRVQVRDDFVGTKQDDDQQNVVRKATPRDASYEKMKGKLSTHEGMDDKMKNKLEGSLQISNPKTPLSNPIDAKMKAKGLNSDKMNARLLGNAEASVGAKMQSKTLSAKKEVVSSNMKIKQKKFYQKLKGDGIGMDNLHSSSGSKLGKHVATNQIQEPEQIIVQALMAPDNCPWTRGRKSLASASKSLVPRDKAKGKDAIPKNMPTRKGGKGASHGSIKDEIMDDNETRGRKSIASASKSLVIGNKLKENDDNPKDIPTGKVAYHESSNDERMEDNNERMEDNVDTNLEDDNSRALVVYGEKPKEICVTMLPSIPSGSHQKQPRDHDTDARSRVRKLLQLFHALYRKLTQVEERGKHKVGRVDNEAAKKIKNDPIYKKLGPIVGNIPGVEVGDEFHFRVELSLVGLHRSNQAGIDITKVNGVLVAISIVASGGYSDELPSSDELIYTGSGGKAGGNKEGGDQKLERGNLALKNCIKTKTPVRVIHGFKGQSEAGHSKGKLTSTFTYDGLYEVVECWQEGPKGEMVFKFKLHRIAGQPELALHAVKAATRKSKVREGLCLPDISQGSERIPICVINTIDDMRPAPFKYITKVIYPSLHEEVPPKGCDCTKACSDSIRCACAVKNGGEIPFNFNGAIVEARPLIYECGPSCRCPPTCHNRVSQHGIKIPLEIFKTGKTGWGVRSLSSISSGSFICEYTGELLEDKEAEKRRNDEYLFDIGNNFHDKKLWEGLKSVVGVESSTSSSETMEGFTIDAAECGNVGRFINHSCSPNLYAQNVLWDHDDMRMPHVMFFAVENIPPLQELTYHYNYKVGEVFDKNHEEKVKHCYCGASDCCGRLY